MTPCSLEEIYRRFRGDRYLSFISRN